MSAAPSDDELAALTGAAPVRSDDPAPDVMRVWRPNWPVLEVFFAALNSCCWRMAPMGGVPLGLDWLQVKALADGHSLTWDRSTMADLQIAEATAREIWAARAPKR